MTRTGTASSVTACSTHPAVYLLRFRRLPEAYHGTCVGEPADRFAVALRVRRPAYTEPAVMTASAPEPHRM